MRADEEDNGNAEAVELGGQLEVQAGKVDEHGYCRPPLSNRPLQFAKLAIDAGQMAHHLVSPITAISSARTPVQACRFHPFTAHAEERGRLPCRGQLRLSSVTSSAP